MSHPLRMSFAGNAEARQRCFAHNLDQLVDLLGVNLKIASQQIGIPYRWLRRMVSAGISRPDQRNRENLARVASYFALPSVNDLWLVDLLVWLVTSKEGRGFVEKFETKVSELVSKQVASSSRLNQKLVDAWANVRGEGAPRQRQPYDAMLQAIVATGRYENLKMLDDCCKRLVKEAYEREFGQGRPDDDRDQRKKTATA